MDLQNSISFDSLRDVSHTKKLFTNSNSNVILQDRSLFQRSHFSSYNEVYSVIYDSVSVLG